jgi:tungstate transport system ATP-binding protein
MKINIENLIKKYNENIALNVKELHIDEGKIYAVLGLNGSGKSTLMECISGLIDYEYGSIFYDGVKDIAAARAKMSICVQKQYLFDKSVRDNIAWGLAARKQSKALIEERMEKYLNYFTLESILYKNAKKLSGGEGAKTALLRTAVLETELNILDEPTASMDIESTFQAETLIKHMAGGKRTVIIVTHDIYQAKRLADEIIFMDKGLILEKGNAKKIFLSPQSVHLKRILSL